MLDVRFKLKSGEIYFLTLDFPSFTSMIESLKKRTWVENHNFAFRVDSIESVQIDDGSDLNT